VIVLKELKRTKRRGAEGAEKKKDRMPDEKARQKEKREQAPALQKPGEIAQ
jgi:hypothetical protein